MERRRTRARRGVVAVFGLCSGKAAGGGAIGRARSRGKTDRGAAGDRFGLRAIWLGASARTGRGGAPMAARPWRRHGEIDLRRRPDDAALVHRRRGEAGRRDFQLMRSATRAAARRRGSKSLPSRHCGKPERAEIEQLALRAKATLEHHLREPAGIPSPFLRGGGRGWARSPFPGSATGCPRPRRTQPHRAPPRKDGG